MMADFALLVMGCEDKAIFAKLLAHLTPTQIKVGAEYYTSGYLVPEIAQRNELSIRTVERMLEAVRSTCLRLNFPLPHKIKNSCSRHVRQLDMELAEFA